MNRSWKQHPTKQWLYGHLPPISKIIQTQWTRYAGHCWRSKDDLISDVLLLTPSHGRANVEQLVRTYLPQLCTNTGCRQGDPPKAIDDRDEWRGTVEEIRARRYTRWWWWWWWWWWKLHIRQVWAGKKNNGVGDKEYWIPHKFNIFHCNRSKIYIYIYIYMCVCVCVCVRVCVCVQTESELDRQIYMKKLRWNNW